MMNAPLQPIMPQLAKGNYSRKARPVNTKQNTNKNIPPVMEEMLVQAKKDFDKGQGFTRLRSPKDIEAWLNDICLM